MSYHVFFLFSSGLRTPLSVPNGTLASIITHVESIEAALGLEREQYQDNPIYWKMHGWPAADLDNKVLCDIVERHNRWVRWLYDSFAEWAEKPIEGGETITPKDAKLFWHGLKTLTVPPERWTGDYYRARMEALYDVMRGRSVEGISFDAAKLSPKQAGSVIRLFESFLDPQDLRLEVPKGHDHLASSYHGEYDWCERCGAVLPDDANNCRKRACPVQAGWCYEDRPLWFREENETDKEFSQRCRNRAEAQHWRKATKSERLDLRCRFINTRYGFTSNAKNWVDLWLTEGER